MRRLGQITQAFAALDPVAAPGFQLNGLKREELLAWNSMILHELSFAGFGQPNRPAAALAQAIERDFGSHDGWRTEFASMGKALGGGFQCIERRILPPRRPRCGSVCRRS